MLTRDAIEARITEPSSDGQPARVARLPGRLKLDRNPARTAMLQRLAASRLFAIGDRSGVLRAAQRRSGRSFRLDVRQRVIVKALVSRHTGRGAARGAALAAHVSYLGRTGAGRDGAPAEFFDRASDEVNATSATQPWAEDRHHFRFIVSPEHGDRISDLRGYTREVLRRVADDLGEPDLSWVATCHFDTDQPHAHVLIRGRRASGRDLVIPRDYVGYGFRARAQEVAQELLGDLSRGDAERRVWRETQADRFTSFDRRLLQAADADRCVDDGVGVSDAWAALTRGRLRRLEALGLAHRVGRRFRLDADLETRLRTLQLRRDIIRTLQQRRLEVGREPAALGDHPIRGRVVARGHHDEIGSAGWVIVQDRLGGEHYGRLRAGQSLPTLGRTIEVLPTPQGAQIRGADRGTDFSRS
jgi:type IV secretory pathway VirD2 relaxase